MNPSQIVDGLAVGGSWLLLLVGAVLGGLGALAHSITSGEPRRPPRELWKSVLVGVIAALGVLYVVEVSTTEKFVGLELLAGFFAQSLLASLESRLQLAVAKEKTEQAKSLAADAMGLAQRTRELAAAGGKPVLPPGVDMEMSALSARARNL